MFLACGEVDLSPSKSIAGWGKGLTFAADFNREKDADRQSFQIF